MITSLIWQTQFPFCNLGRNRGVFTQLTPVPWWWHQMRPTMTEKKKKCLSSLQLKAATWPPSPKTESIFHAIKCCDGLGFVQPRGGQAAQKWNVYLLCHTLSWNGKPSGLVCTTLVLLFRTPHILLHLWSHSDKQRKIKTGKGFLAKDFLIKQLDLDTLFF